MIRKIITSSLVVVAALTSAAVCLGSPAAPVVHEMTQADGSKIQARQWGDEWLHGWELKSGYSIVLNNRTNNWEYAGRDDRGRLFSTGKVAGKDPVPRNIQSHLRPAGEVVSQARARKGPQPALSRKAALTGTGHLPVLMINFSDTSTTYTVANFQSSLFGAGVNSMKDYYEEISYGQYTVDGGSSGVSGWYQAAQTHDYYGLNVNGQDQHPAELVIEALAAADATMDFSEYDSDGDCYCDVVAIIHQGGGEEAGGASTDIWSHSWNLYSAEYYGDGTGVYITNDLAQCGYIKVNDYVIQPEELWGQQQTIGVFAHEYGHAIGLPDLYDTDYSSEGIGDWGLMSGGSWNDVGFAGDSPAHMSAWSKYVLGWVNPVQVAGALGQVWVAPSANEDDVYQALTGSPEIGGEYFLIENRQQMGFDAGLPGAGLAIWHVDEAKSGNTQECLPFRDCTTRHYKVALEQADGRFDLERGLNRGDQGDLFPGTGNNTEFTGSTWPSSKLYDGSDSGLSATSITQEDSDITVTLTTAAPPEECDVNQDGVVNQEDADAKRAELLADLITWYRTCYQPKLACGDVNNDGSVNRSDLIASIVDFRTQLTEWTALCLP